MFAEKRLHSIRTSAVRLALLVLLSWAAEERAKESRERVDGVSVGAMKDRET
jgi:hypothetical protein